MSAIWKYPVPFSHKAQVLMPADSVVLNVHEQGENIYLWVLVDDQLPETVVRTFAIYGTGHKLPTGKMEYLGTVHVERSQLVWHVFEVLQ